MKTNRKKERARKKFLVQNRRGFTLVELVIAITIIGILSTAAIPRALRYVDQSKISSDSQTANSYESSIEILLASGDLRMNTSGSAATAIYFTNEGSENDSDCTYDQTNVKNLAGTASLDLYFSQSDMFSDGSGDPINGADFAELFEDNAKLSDLKYYDGVKLYFDENGASGHEFIRR